MTFSPGDQWLYAGMIGCCAAAILWVVLCRMLNDRRPYSENEQDGGQNADQ